MKYIKLLSFLLLYVVKASTQPILIAANKQDSTFENIAVYRLQVRITTDAGTDMGSDKPTWIILNDKDECFYLGKAIDNFQEGHTDLYDILSFNIKKIKDIQFIRMGQTGADEDYWGLKQIELLINGNANPLFSKRYAAPLQIHNNSTGLINTNMFAGTIAFYSIATSSDLRNSEGWKITDKNRNIQYAPAVLTAEYITSIAEAGMGDYISRNSGGLGWSSKHYNNAIYINYISPSEIMFTYILEARVSYATNPVLYIRHYMNFECKDKRLLITLSGASVEQNGGLLDGILPYYLDHFMAYLGKGLKIAYGYTAIGKFTPVNFLINKLYTTSVNPYPGGVQTPINDCDALLVLPDASVQIKNMAIKNPASIQNKFIKN